MTADRRGCCDNWPKPCSYHEGYQDACDELAVEINSLTAQINSLTDQRDSAQDVWRPIALSDPTSFTDAAEIQPELDSIAAAHNRAPA